MKKTLKTILVVVALVLAISVFTACELLDKINNSLEHTGGQASCTEQAICEDCGVHYGEKLPHVKETTPAKAPTCTEPGYSASVVCKNCGEVLTASVEIEALGHSYNAVVTAPTCTTGGYTTYTCSCGDSYVADEVGPSGHDYQAVVTAPTCTTGGYTTYTCSCGDSYVADEVGPSGHDHKAVVTAPTCTTGGFTTYTCSCGDSYVADEVAALNHDIIADAAVAPNCENTGLTAGEHCSRCDYRVAQEVVAALGHNIIVDAAEDATCEGTGLTAGEHCSRCDHRVAQQVTAALGHAWENCECTRCEKPLTTLSNTDSFDFVTVDGLNAALASGKLGYTGTFRNNGDSHQFAANSSVQFVVPANTTVSIVGHSTGYGVFDVYVNGEKHEMAGALTFTVREEAKVVIVPCDEKGAQYAYLKSITLSEFVDRTIVEDTTITFGSGGNYKDSIVDFSGIEIRDNGGNNSQVKNGSFELILKAGSKVVIHGYKGYTSYSLNGGAEITDEWYTYIALEDTVLTVTPVNGNNYFYSIEITLHEGVRLVEEKAPTCTAAGHGPYYACECHPEPLTDKAEVAASGHKHEAVVTAPTCTEAGYTTYTCACGDTYKGNEAAALGHAYDSVCDADCNNCGEAREVAGHADENPCDHECDRCGLSVSECADENKDHKCDVCKDVMSKCADNNQDHFCDHCGVQNSHCIDIEGNHKCSWCGKLMEGVCADEYPRDHECDVCGNLVSECADENKDHKCDVCKDVMSKCADNDQDHFCDYCGVQNSHCIDVNDDHKCEWCGKIVAGLCVDEDPCDHECDVCGNSVSECADENKDHKCDICGDVMSKCADENGDYKCDVCSTILLPPDGTVLTVEQALKIAELGGTSYTTQKYYITGIVTGLYNTQYGNFYIKDPETGKQICIYGLYSADGKTRYDAMSYKPVNGDEVTVYTVLGKYNTTLQGKNAWLDDVVAHEHDYKTTVTNPGCLTEGYTTYTCSICGGSHVDDKVDALGHTTENGECERCGQTIGGAPTVGTLAEFTFGANGSASHVDPNSKFSSGKSYTVNGYTLKFTTATNCYDGGRDAKGNSCMKMGTSSKTGSFTITVPDNVTEVVIYVAQYKANTTKIKVNGTSYTITTASNNGAYTAIKIDTTTTKTITFETVSGGVRCMIDTIVFNGYAQ